MLSGTLEDETKFSGFKDMVDIVPLYRGRGDKAQLAGEFKVRLLIHKEVGALLTECVHQLVHSVLVSTHIIIKLLCTENKK